MRYLLVLCLSLSLNACAWFSARTLTPEQMQGMKELMALENVQACWGAGGGAAIPNAEFNLRGAVCKGLEEKPTIDQLIQLMNGVSITVTRPN